jgi:ATP-dependent Clp protease, protease subunit
MTFTNNTTSTLVPMVIKRTGDGERSMDIFSRLLDERIIMLTDEINDQTASLVVSQLLYLQSEDSSKDITIYISSPGGVVTAGWSIIDTMNLIKNDVSTVAIGLTASMATSVLISGTKGKRYILPHTEVMIHQPSGGAKGMVSDLEIAFKSAIKTKKDLTEYYSQMTGQPYNKLEKDMDRDYFMSAKEALDYGIVDKIIGL